MNISELNFTGIKETLNKLKQWFFDNVCNVNKRKLKGNRRDA